ncbi:MAG TPA: GGDEF domain-containing protein [Roseiflexaceae bacterium]|nr:GGDEF domain-containing protein [Roseiflexaceae bacterium]
MIAFFSISWVLLFVRPNLLELVERLSFATFASYIVVHVQPFVLEGVDTYTLASLAQWFPLVYTAAFFFLSTRHAIVGSVLVYFSLLIPYMLNLPFHDAAFSSSEQGLLMFNMFCSHPVYIVTLSGIAKLKTHITQASAYADILHIAASVDYLTGVANRRTTAQQLLRALEQAHRADTAMSVILLDIDHFKSINDTFGHDVGDTVLVQMSALLQEHLRASDTLGRWGGEEFLIVVNAAGAAAVAEMADRLRTVIAQHEFPQIGQLTASFGVAALFPSDTPESLVKRADQALYAAKQAGRNRVEATVALANG